MLVLGTTESWRPLCPAYPDRRVPAAGGNFCRGVNPFVRRAVNLVGWFMLAEGAATVVMTTGSAYAIFGRACRTGWPRTAAP
jgi:hypothetical protein